ncbi:phage shock protein PspA [Vibrio salinus]|uniref:phage shock protein PspA n=1 Tax=Vibrio salinus TaxID=2899784 RepID=UPI001E49B470|nr:phage shock protein PspA [Vibrio salinus]MCE0492647.1 phage shock protein PspA [Vibrio salinus]
MGIFSRFADIVNSNISALLDKAEDPEKMIKLIIQEMEDTLVEVRSDSVKAIADKKDLTRKITALEHQVSEWSDKATLALSKNREDLARAALIEKQKLVDIINDLKNELVIIDETVDKLTGEINKLESKIIETRAKQQALVIRNTAAGNRRNVQKHLYKSQANDTMAKFEQFSRKIDELDAEADSYAKSAQKKSLQDQFAELQAEDEIEKELEALKQKLNKEADSNK